MKDCIFCEIVKGTKKSWKVFEDEYTYAFFTIGPVNEYHTLVIPKKHYKNIFDTPKEVFVYIANTIKTITHLFEKKLGIQDIQIINSSGEHAQQDVFHLHFHIVPRKKGDDNDISWNEHPEYVERFDELLSKLA